MVGVKYDDAENCDGIRPLYVVVQTSGYLLHSILYSVRCTILSLAGCYYFPFSVYSVLLWDTFELGYCVVVTVTMGTSC